jgi:general secretion pathway protein J
VIRRGQAGFTLIEIVIAMALLAAMLGMAWSGVSFSLRSWDAGANAGHRTADMRLSQNFLRRELSEMFPMRFKDPMNLRLALEGTASRLRFVSTRPAGLSTAGLSLVSLEVESEGRKRNLVMRRAAPNDEATDFGPLDRAEATTLYPDVDTVVFTYFGTASDIEQPKWYDEWKFAKLPAMIRMRVVTPDGVQQPETLVRLMLGEEAGCLENSFQRGCRPRRP